MTIQTQQWPLVGGLDLVSPAITKQPGRTLLAENYECLISGGYRRIDGYALFDGATSAAVVPGSGPIRGIWEYGGDVYAFRNNVGGTKCVMHKASVSGWQSVYTNFPANGHYRFVNYNFTGHAGTEKMYGVNGVGKAFQFDGTTVTLLTTGMTTDIPLHVSAHKNHLFLAFSGGSLQHSAINDPTSWTLLTGAGEIGMGSEITGLRSMQGNALVIASAERMSVLYGTSSSDWDLRAYTQDIGAVADTVSGLEADMLFFNGTEITSLAASQAFGDFESANLSRDVEPLLKSFAGSTVGVSVNKDKSQYRLFSSAGLVVVLTMAGRAVVGYSTWNIPDTPSYVANGYLGCTDGSVMKLDTGTSFAGSEIESLLRLPYTNLGLPHLQKRFRKAFFEIQGGASATFKYTAEFDYAGSVSSEATEISFQGGGGFWGIDSWGEFVWGSSSVASADAYLNGTGRNISLFIYQSSATTAPYTIESVRVNYTPRQLER